MDKQFSELDLLLFRERSRTFCGSFKVPLDSLQHEDSDVLIRQEQEPHIQELVRIYKNEGCWPLDAINHADALIPISDASCLPKLDGNQLAPLLPNKPLQCLNGYYRIEAARRFLKGENRWWSIDLYSDGMSLFVMARIDQHTRHRPTRHQTDSQPRLRLQLQGAQGRRAVAADSPVHSSQRYQSAR
jgi:hypothetical protein